MEIESRLLPCGLHTIGKPPTAAEAIATLVSIAALEREDDGLRSLPGLLSESVGKSIEDVYKGNNKGVLDDVELIRSINETSRKAVSAMVSSLTGRDGRVTLQKNIFGIFIDFLKKLGFTFPSPWFNACVQNGFNKVDSISLDKLFDYLLVFLMRHPLMQV